MASFLDFTRHNIIVQDVARRLGVTQIDASAHTMLQFTGIMLARRDDKYATAEHAKKAQIGHFSGAELIWGLVALSMRDQIVEADIMIERV
jgi:hypothetical protein